MPTRTPKETFLALVHSVAEQKTDELPLLYAEDTHVSHPFDPFKGPPLIGREALAAHFNARRSAPTATVAPVDIRVHETADPEVVIGEFSYAGTIIATGESFSYPCIFVMRVVDGEIVESRDYVDHLGSAEARGQLESLLDRIRQARSTDR